MGIDIWEVIDAAATKPFGFMPFYPGPGLGGHCIPVDPFYLSWKAREYDFATRFIELAGEVNTAMPYHVVDAVANSLNNHKKSMKGSTDRKSTRLNSSHGYISYAVFCLKKKNEMRRKQSRRSSPARRRWYCTRMVPTRPTPPIGAGSRRPEPDRRGPSWLRPCTCPAPHA